MENVSECCVRIDFLTSILTFLSDFLIVTMRDTTATIRDTATRDTTSTSTTSTQGKKKSVVLGEQIAENFDYAMTPRIDLLQSENATAWIYARLTIQYFGERFRYRTDTYIGKWIRIYCFH